MVCCEGSDSVLCRAAHARTVDALLRRGTQCSAVHYLVRGWEQRPSKEGFRAEVSCSAGEQAETNATVSACARDQTSVCRRSIVEARAHQKVDGFCVARRARSVQRAHAAQPHHCLSHRPRPRTGRLSGAPLLAADDRPVVVREHDRGRDIEHPLHHLEVARRRRKPQRRRARVVPRVLRAQPKSSTRHGIAAECHSTARAAPYSE